MGTEEVGSCHAEIVKVSTNADGSCRITLDIPEYNIDICSKLMEIKMSGESLLSLGIIHVRST